MVALSKSSSAAPPAPGEIDYPDSDGEPMADNTRQFEWIVRLKENLDAMLPDFVAGDLLWYPVEGHPEVRLAPDVLVALGRPKGFRGSYLQFREEGVAPAVVFEVLSPRNTLREMIRKSLFYSRHGAREFIVIDPEQELGWAYLRAPTGETEEIPNLDGWTSPILGIRFVRAAEHLEVYRPDGTLFLSFQELEAKALADAERATKAEERATDAEGRVAGEAARAAKAEERAADAEGRVAGEAERAARAEERAADAEERARRLTAQLAALGIDPDAG